MSAIALPSFLASFAHFLRSSAAFSAICLLYVVVSRHALLL